MHGTELAIKRVVSTRHRAINPAFLPVKLPNLPGSINPDDPAWTAVEASLRGAVERIERWESPARAGQAEGIHHLRTATRRLRSELRTLANLVDACWRDEIEVELKWLTEVLGSARDLDVLSERLRKRVADTELDDMEREELTPIFETLAQRRERALDGLTEALGGERYLMLRRRLEWALMDRPWKQELSPTCREVLGPIADASWEKLKKHARKLRPSDEDEAFHDVRKLAKRARYTAELVAPLISRGQSKGALGFIRKTTRVQGKLGDHHDASIAIAEIESRIHENIDNQAFGNAAQILIEAEKAASRRSRKAFFDRMGQARPQEMATVDEEVVAVDSVTAVVPGFPF